MINGLQFLEDRGVPSGAVSAMLVLLFTLSVGPYIAGWSIGPYSFPELFSPQLYWSITILSPVVWIALFARVFGGSSFDWKAFAIYIGRIAVIVIPLAYLFAPIAVTEEFSGRVAPAKTSPEFIIELPTAQNVEAKLTKLDPLGLQVWFNFCGTERQEIKTEETQKRNCSSAQLAEGSPFVRYLPKGPATFVLFNFEDNKVAIDYKLSITYVRRRIP